MEYGGRYKSCGAWFTTSNDLRVGNEQKDKSFWERITQYYNENRPVGRPMRESTAIKTHYYYVMPNVNLFTGWYNNFYNNRKSGQSDDDVLAAATHEKWKREHKNKAFKFEHVWKVMKQCKKWAPQPIGRHADKKARTSESEAHTSSTNPDTEGEREIRSRLIGQQKANRKNKQKATEEENQREDINVKWKQMQQYQAEHVELRDREVHHQLRADLVEHIWARYGGD
ncbi:hypothetical protein DH2020_021293 [Rehmannia glutinosa]|uniref:No apical meristem-associated C-terminal domain-containing protein n=1 Tax=Rehmannia glutinosa TaxID=99300 RepID=A0ABR0W9Z4_REHGL